MPYLHCTCMCYRLIQYIIKSQLCSTGRQSGLQIVRSGFESHDFSPNKKVLSLVALSPLSRYTWVGIMGTLYNAPTRPRMLLTYDSRGAYRYPTDTFIQRLGLRISWYGYANW